MANDIQINPDAQVSLHSLIPENALGKPVPLLIIDDCLLAPEQLIVAASAAQFSKEKSDFYPGLRATLPSQYSERLSDMLKPALSQHFSSATLSLNCSFSAFSIATQASHTLSPIQSIPHYDDTAQNKFALVHYLFKEDLGGTGFFRHKKTGYWQITPENQNHYMKTLGVQATTEGLPEPGYIQGNSALFEQYCRVQARFNRAIIYPSNLLHSGLINSTQGLFSSPEKGRLTANLALEVNGLDLEFASDT